MRLEALQIAGNAAATSLNAVGDSVVERVEQIFLRVNEVALHGVRHGTSLTLAAAHAHTATPAKTSMAST